MHPRTARLVCAAKTYALHFAKNPLDSSLADHDVDR